MLQKIQQLVETMKSLDALIDQLVEQVSDMNPDAQLHSLRIALEWVEAETANAEAALYELNKAVQTAESRARQLHEAGELD